ncbi:DUF4389 domain-containing protein [Pseudonocardia xishanensis]
MTNTPHPVRVTGRLDPGVSRGLWLVKWLLLIPHLIVLAALGVAFTVLTVVAFFAILVTGRYPRAIFGFNVGVLRWGWRVVFYGYAAGATDRYPPFTLADVPDYPARLDVDYPERLSRGLVLVKWWLLAIPQYVVLAFLLGAGSTVVDRVDGLTSSAFDGGLILVLVLFAVVAMLFTGRYPRGLFDLAVGLDRWVLRVIAYTSLMTDVYPPFRLDQGGEEPLPPLPPTDTGGPGEAAEPPRSEAPGTVPAAAGPRAGVGATVMSRPTAAPPRPPAAPEQAVAVPPPSAGRSVTIVIGALLTAFALGMVAVGITGMAVDRAGRDAAGFIASGIGSAATAGHALRTDPLVIESPQDPDLVAQLLGDVTLQARAVGGRDVFVGIAPSSSVAGYLGGVAAGVWRANGAVPAGIVDVAGGAPATPPAAQAFWTVSASGPGTQTVTWTPAPGTWTAVVMNADGSAPVQAEVQVGAQVPVLRVTAAAMLGVGLGLLVIGVVLVAVGARPTRQPAVAAR